jgi:hypothetical protein
MTGFALDDLTFTLRHFLPHLNRDSIYLILKAKGLGRLPAPSVPRKVTKQFKEYDLGFVHMDIKHLPKLHVIGSGSRKRYLYVAIDRASCRDRPCLAHGSPRRQGRGDGSLRHGLSEGSGRRLPV